MEREQNNIITLSIKIGNNEFLCTGPANEVNRQRNYFFYKIINKKEENIEKNKMLKEFYAQID